MKNPIVAMVGQEEFEAWIDAEARRAKNILGVGETNMAFRKSYPTLDGWRFDRLTKINKRVVGLDIVKENVAITRKLGYDFRYADIEKAETMTKALGTERFDLILMLDVIEHLSNTGTALENLRDHLSSNGKIIFATPTPWYFRDMIRVLTGRRADIYYDHTCFVTEEHIRVLAKRHGLRVTASGTVNFNKRTSAFQRSILGVLKRFNYQLMNHYVFVLERRD